MGGGSTAPKRCAFQRFPLAARPQNEEDGVSDRAKLNRRSTAPRIRRWLCGEQRFQLLPHLITQFETLVDVIVRPGFCRHQHSISRVSLCRGDGSVYSHENDFARF